MSIKPDHWIRKMAQQQRMIEPFEPEQVRGPVISYGLSSYGYDIRLADEFKVPADNHGMLDPKALDAGTFADLNVETFDLAPAHLCAGPDRGVFSHPAQRPDPVRGQEQLRPLWRAGQCDPL